jgi:hypothetical protein
MTLLLRWFVVGFVLVAAAVAASARAQPVANAIDSIAFYYGANPPLADLRAFDIAVVEPAHVPDPRRHAHAEKDGAHELFAYVSLGEVQPSRPYYRDLPPGALRGANEAWGSRVIDQAAPGWTEFFLSHIIAPLWESGWRGFFIDTLDSYQLFAATDAERAAQAQALSRTLREFKRRYPEARLILNRGFELLPEIADITFAVAAESLYQGYDAARARYRPVSNEDRAWLLGQLETVRDRYRLPVIAIDYVDPMEPGARELARDTARRIRNHGFVPWVADGKLESIGVSSIELIPRTVLVLLRSGGVDLHVADAQRYLGMPLNHLGLRYEFVDLTQEALPDILMAGRYAGVVAWLEGDAGGPKLFSWLAARMREGVRIAMFNGFGFTVDPKRAPQFGLRMIAGANSGRLSLKWHDPQMMGFEAEPMPDPGQLLPIGLLPGYGRSLLQLSDVRGNVYDGAALTPWGGYVLVPYGVTTLALQGQSRWVIDPVAFLRQALALPDVPVPDVTTEGGRRILMVHIDGDGFASRAERPGAPFASMVLLKDFLERYRVPTTMSVIEGEVGGSGLFKALSTELEDIARRMFALPHVEPASHSYSHPFNWGGAIGSARDQGEVEADYHLNLPGYAFNLSREIKGSLDYINTRLAPPGKKASVFLWTGNCEPPPEALAEVYRHGALNMNGGDTLITASNESITAIASQGIRKGGYYQVFAPNQNENVYTENWRGPFYGYERVIETFRLTETPVRYKPINIYYHTYAASKPASIAALHRVYRWALAQTVTPLYASQYIRKVLDFEATTLARELATGDLVVRTGADLRTLRMPRGANAPSLALSTAVAGLAPGPAGEYLILSGAQARLVTKSDVRPVPYLRDANGTVSDFERKDGKGGALLRFALASHVPAAFSLAHAAGCGVTANGRPVASLRSDGNDPVSRYALPESTAGARQHIEVRCK